jgi:hypothetical protein
VIARHGWADVDSGIERFTPRRETGDMRAKTGALRPLYLQGTAHREACADSARLAGLRCCIGWGHSACRLLLPFDFGEPTSNMGMLRLDLADLVKGGTRFVKLPLHQTRVPVHKGLVRQARRGHVLWRDCSGGRLSALPTSPDDPPCQHNESHDYNHASHAISS